MDLVTSKEKRHDLKAAMVARKTCSFSRHQGTLDMRKKQPLPGRTGSTVLKRQSDFT